MGPFHLESIAAGGDRAVLRIDGDIDACTAPQLRERVMDLAGHGTVHVIADLRGVGFLDSAALGALVAARNELRGRAGSLMLVAGTGRIAQVLRITGLTGASRCIRASWRPSPPTRPGRRPSPPTASAPGYGAASTGCCDASAAREDLIASHARARQSGQAAADRPCPAALASRAPDAVPLRIAGQAHQSRVAGDTSRTTR
jgi:anti-sigma B factor antagonist